MYTYLYVIYSTQFHSIPFSSIQFNRLQFNASISNRLNARNCKEERAAELCTRSAAAAAAAKYNIKYTKYII